MGEVFLPTTVNWPFNPDAGGGFYPSFGFHPFTPLGEHHSEILTNNILTLTPPEGCTEVLIQILDVNCRFTLDGTDPTSSTGFQLVADDSPLVISISKTTVIKIIGENTGASVEYQFGR